MANYYSDNTDLRFHLEHPLMERIAALREDNYAEAGQYDDAPRNFADAMDNYAKVMEIVGEICGDIIGPNAEEVDHEGPKVVDGHVEYAPGTARNHQALTRAGLVGMPLPRRYDGLNFPMVPYVMSAELVSRADAGFANIWGLQDCAETINDFASEDQKSRFLPMFYAGATAAMGLTEPDAGSDLQAVQLRATYCEADGTWRLNGVKRFITNGDADINLVLARSEEGTTDGRGLSMFIYDRRSDAVTVRRIENKLGIKGSPTCELVFSNAPAELVGERKLGLIKYVMSLMNGARLGVGAQSVGIAEAALREAQQYASERMQYGKTIDQFPAVYQMLAEMQAKTRAIRSLLYETTRFVDIYRALTVLGEKRKLTPEERAELKAHQRLADMFTPLLKLMSSEYCNQIAYDSLQIHGGSGFMKDYPIERIYRDARITTIYEGTSQLQVIAAIRGIITGTYAARIKEYEGNATCECVADLREALAEMAADLDTATRLVTDTDKANPGADYLDFNARRLVEMAGNTIMGWLLVLDTQRDKQYLRDARLMVKLGSAQNKMHLSYLQRCTPADAQMCKVER